MAAHPAAGSTAAAAGTARRPPGSDHCIPRPLPGQPMTRPAIPARDDVLTTLAQLQAGAENTGRQPTALALARRLGMANTTSPRNSPDIATDLPHQAAERRQPPQPPSR